MGLGRKAGTRSPGFIDSFLGLLTDFYASVVQNIAAWQPKAPQLKREVTQEAAPTAEHDPVPPSPAPEAASDPSPAGDSPPV
jgi:hypothetical protein